MFPNMDSLVAQRELFLFFPGNTEHLSFQMEELLLTQPMWGKGVKITLDWVYSLHLYWDVSALLDFPPPHKCS